MDDTNLVQIAAQYGVPPSILAAVAARDTGSGTMGMASGTLTARGLDQKTATDNPDLILQVAAQTLQQAYQKYGSWEQALSDYSTGDPTAYQNPSSSIGGFVYSVLGGAATEPNYGLTGMSQANLNLMMPGLQGLATHMQSLSEMGGVISPQSVSSFRGYLGTIGTNATGPGASAFPGDPFSWGECTWFAAGAASSWLHGVNGNAYEWLDSAQAQAMPTSQQAQVGAVVVYGRGGMYSAEDGHVGIVTNVNPDGTFQVTSDHWGGLGDTNVRTSTAAGVEGFILPPSPEQGQQTAQKALQLSGTNLNNLSEQQAAVIGKTVQHQPPETKPKADPKAAATGKSDRPPKPIQHDPTSKPAEVEQFAQHLKGLGIDPQRLIDNFASFASMLRYHGGTSPTLQQYAGVANLDASEQMAYVRAQPHPTVPSLTLGQVKDASTAAGLHSVANLGRMPYDFEAQRFAANGAGWKEMNDYYQGRAQAQGQTKQPETFPAQPSNVVPLPGQHSSARAS